MREARRTIQQLAAIGPDGPPVVSLYLDSKWSDEQQRERARLFLRGRAAQLKSAWKGRAYGEEIARAVDGIVKTVNRDIIAQGDPEEVGWDGFAFFFSPGRDISVGLHTRVRMQNELEVAEQPKLLQIAKVLTDYSPAFVVLLDGRWVRVFEVALGAVLVEADLEQYLPDRVDSGDRGPFAKSFPARVGPAAVARGDGMSQMRFQRHVKNHLQHNLRTAGELLERLCSHETGAPVIICGEEELRGLFKRVCSEPIRRRIAHETRLDSRVPRHRAVGLAVKALETINETRHRREIDEAIGQALGAGMAVIGTEDTLLALHESRLHTIYVDMSDGFGLGWRCGACTAFGQKAELACPFCGGRVLQLDLAQEVVRRAVENETRTVIVSGHTRLRHYRGMAGTLRRGISPTAVDIGYVGHEPLPPT